MDPKLAEHHEKIDQLIAERKEQHEFLRHHTRLITATAACFTIGLLILGIFYSMMYLPIATEKVNQKLNSENTPLVSPQPTVNPTDLYTEMNRSATANWKTYTSDKNGFTFQYPIHLKISEQIGKYYTQDAKIVNARNYLPEEEFKHNDAISITLFTIPVDKPINDMKSWLENISIGNRVDGTTGPLVRSFSPYETANINGFSYYDGQEIIRKNIALYKYKNVFIFSLNPTGQTGSSYDDNKEAVKVFDQILSTFKFLD